MNITQYSTDKQYTSHSTDKQCTSHSTDKQCISHLWVHLFYYSWCVISLCLTQELFQFNSVLLTDWLSLLTRHLSGSIVRAILPFFRSKCFIYSIHASYSMRWRVYRYINNKILKINVMWEFVWGRKHIQYYYTIH